MLNLTGYDMYNPGTVVLFKVFYRIVRRAEVSLGPDKLLVTGRFRAVIQ